MKIYILREEERGERKKKNLFTSYILHRKREEKYIK